MNDDDKFMFLWSMGMVALGGIIGYVFGEVIRYL